jgi:hypothetical protein
MISVFFIGGQIFLGGVIAPTINPLIQRASTATAENINECMWTIETGG